MLIQWQLTKFFFPMFKHLPSHARRAPTNAYALLRNRWIIFSVNLDCSWFVFFFSIVKMTMSVNGTYSNFVVVRPTLQNPKIFYNDIKQIKWENYHIWEAVTSTFFIFNGSTSVNRLIDESYNQFSTITGKFVALGWKYHIYIFLSWSIYFSFIDW